jgi:hypothetical protein
VRRADLRHQSVDCALDARSRSDHEPSLGASRRGCGSSASVAYTAHRRHFRHGSSRGASSDMLRRSARCTRWGGKGARMQIRGVGWAANASAGVADAYGTSTSKKARRHRATCRHSDLCPARNARRHAKRRGQQELVGGFGIVGFKDGAAVDQDLPDRTQASAGQPRLVIARVQALCGGPR